MHAEWIDEDRAGALPNPPMAEWLFALLVRIDVLLTADETATLRALAAACMRARQRIALDPGADPADLRMAASSMVVAIVHHVFGQRDLE
nr:hypothetical protein HK105_005404 [Polyrhizophydium stewartii]